MDLRISIEKENKDEDYRVQKNKGNLKELARGQNKENEIGRDVGVKRTLWADEEEVDARRQKTFCGSKSIPLDLSAVSTKQQRWEP